MKQDQDQTGNGATMLSTAQAQDPALRQPSERDKEVLQAIAGGEHRKALALCVRLHGASVGRLCMALVGTQAEAQELAQETFISAHDAFVSYRGEGTVRAFLFGIARRVCSRHVETRARRESKLRLVHGSDQIEMRDASDIMAQRQRSELARRALEELRPSERDAVVLRFDSELSFREVAEVCGVDEATARKRVSRALSHLRQTLGEA